MRPLHPPFHDRPRFPRGFRCAATLCGLKREGKDLALFASDTECAAAAVFTRNHVAGAPVLLGRELIQRGRLQAVVVNSRIANVGTGPEGVEDARRMGAAAAHELSIDPGLVLVSSTGVIGVRLPVDKVEAGLRGLAARLHDDPLEGAEGIMTTDTHPKAVSLSVPGPEDETSAPVITMVGKGSGMIAPNMATMLVYAFTDAALDASALDAMLRRTVDRTFNMLSVDSDTSTSDTCAILANGRSGTVDAAAFEGALQRACIRMTEMLARDGEGATRLLRVTVGGAWNEMQARVVARSLIDSPLIKTMVFGGDPNVGRILMAVGKCVDCRIVPEHIFASIGGVPVVERGMRAAFEDDSVRSLLRADPVDIEVALGVGRGDARAWGCDLTPGYIEENAAYYSS
jgi:glutamate N-acetyltransferase/amino-acid N-acetyltransferase